MKIPTFKNHFLIATPTLQDSNFSRSVIFLCEHSQEGAMGLIINKPLNVQLSNVLEHLEITGNLDNLKNTPTFTGGPVGPESGFVIHEPYLKDEDNDDLVISASEKTLIDIAEGHGPRNYIVVLGYTGWEAGQLEREISQNDWLIAHYDKNIIFNTPIHLRWQRAATLLGIDITQLSAQVGHA